MDYKSKLIEVVNNPTKYFKNKHAIDLCKEYRNVIVKDSMILQPKHYKKLYIAIMAGDTKGRTLRAIKQTIYADYMKQNNAYSDNLNK